MSDEPRDPQLEGLLQLVMDVVLDRIRGFEIGVVTSYDDVQQSVTVQPAVARSRVSQTGEREAKPASRRQNVPVWYFGAGGARITAAPEPGDYGLILYCSLSLERWKRRGGVIDPGDDRRHQESDAIFIPGMHVLTSPPTSAAAGAIVVHPPNGGVVKIGGDTGTKPTYQAPPLQDALKAVLSAISAAIGASGTPAGAAAAQTALEVPVTGALAVFDLAATQAQTSKTEVK